MGPLQRLINASALDQRCTGDEVSIRWRRPAQTAQTAGELGWHQNPCTAGFFSVDHFEYDSFPRSIEERGLSLLVVILANYSSMQGLTQFCGWPDVARLRCVGPVDRRLRRRPALPDGAPGVIMMFHARELRCTQTFLGESVGNALPYGGASNCEGVPGRHFRMPGAQRWPRSSRPATSAIHCQQILSS